MPNPKENFIFGPVPSRRLGRSLGVDIIPFKTCSLDCIYCQLGRTPRTSIERKSYAPPSDVLRQLKERLSDDVRPDYITFSGSGEPTLHADIGTMILSIKQLTDIPVVVLTNGSLLWDTQVQEALMGADIVIPSLDAGNSEDFRQINRPHPDLEYDRIVEGLIKFRRRYRRRIWLEVFLVGGFNTTPSQILQIREHIDNIRPDRIQLNTVARPPAEDFALQVSDEEMGRIRALFGGHAEVIAPYEKDITALSGTMKTEDILALLRRRPCSLEHIVDGLAIHRNEALKYLAELGEMKLLRKIRREGIIYYQATEDNT